MSRLLINDYLREIGTLRRVSGSQSEMVLREAFKDLLKAWCRQKDFVFLAESRMKTTQRTDAQPDGTILQGLAPFGFWEAKDIKDNLDAEIRGKLRKGYPQTNIIFENGHRAVLIQNREPVMDCGMTDADELGRLLDLFFGYEPQAVREFRQAMVRFQENLPTILDGLRAAIGTAYATSPDFARQAAAFLAHAQETINPTLAEADVREMLIQHILTEEIFNHVFGDTTYHRDNNIARELTRLEGAFFDRTRRREILAGLDQYYTAIRSAAAEVRGHTEKQTFLKLIYENFYKVYNPKAADRLGVVYTPNEIVRFMIDGADWLCEKHFGKTLIDHGVEILDPATGTGTFICDLIDHFSGEPEKLKRKYREELHANEVAILPYYVANLNIEATYAAVAGQYAEFPNLCFVDTLDNVAGLGIKAGYQHDLFAGLSDENIARVQRQNKRKISVVIGNPPYNANQQNENDNNKNRAYPKIDDLIKRSFVKLSTAQKTKVYDMYARFFRWAFDRVHDDGIIAFVTNRSFIDSRTFDGFRRYVQENFAECWIVDLGGDVRANPKISGTKHNVFGIQTGVAISFMVKRKGAKQCVIRYVRRPEFDTKDDKLAWLGSSRLSSLAMERVEPDKKANWVNLTENDWDDLLPVADKKTKAAEVKGQERAVFKFFVSGIKTNRDEWAYGETPAPLEEKAAFFREVYKAQSGDDFDSRIKWSRDLKVKRRSRTVLEEEPTIVSSTWRPFVRRCFVWDDKLSDIFYDAHLRLFGKNGLQRTPFVSVSGTSAMKPFQVLAGDQPQDYEAIEKCNLLPRYRYTTSGERLDNITDWALKVFTDHYGKAAGVTRDAIFAYVYAALHDPVWRETYAINLKREFPRIPLHPDFRRWADWGQRLLDLHIGYESVEPWPVTRRDLPDAKSRAGGVSPKVILKSDPAAGTVTLDSETVISGIPAVAWDYRLGNRAGIDWVLDQHKEKTPKDPTIRARFNTYRFADHKEKVADLIARVARVSVETMAVLDEMRAARR